MARYWYSVHMKAARRGEYDTEDAYSTSAADISDLRQKLIRMYFTKGRVCVINVYEYRSINTPGPFIGKLWLEGSPGGTLWYTTIRPRRDSRFYVVNPRTGNLGASSHDRTNGRIR